LLHTVPSGQPVSLALIDLDDLKWINDHHGHGVGDKALRALAESLQTICRGSDELARIGGDEFAVILPNATTKQAEHVAERFLHELWTRNLPIEEGVVHVSASIGVAEARQTDGPRSWMDRADQWLYRAKGMGKNRVLGEAAAAALEPPV
jgi:diguanylate cyclase (GGDEF)-like protein